MLQIHANIFENTYWLCQLLHVYSLVKSKFNYSGSHILADSAICIFIWIFFVFGGEFFLFFMPVGGLSFFPPKLHLWLGVVGFVFFDCIYNNRIAWLAVGLRQWFRISVPGLIMSRESSQGVRWEIIKFDLIDQNFFFNL